MLYVPVVNKNQKPLMPTTSFRAAKWIKSGKATGFWKRGIYCVRLNTKPSDNKFQEIAIGIDPGSKREGFTIKSEAHTFLNIQTHAIDWVKRNMETRKGLRKARRQRNTPYRKCRKNRSRRSFLAPSTKARWQWKLRICKWLLKMFHVKFFIVEDTKARTHKNGKIWNCSFSPLEIGKNWFYEELRKLGEVDLKAGYETFEMRNNMGLKKSKNKLSNDFSAHCMDSWVLANWKVGGHVKSDNTKVLEIVPLQFHRHQLHYQNFSKGEVRKQYGGTISLGFKRGSLVFHKKYGLCIIGGTSDIKKRGIKLSLHDKNTNKRLTQVARKEDIKFLTYNTWRVLIK